MRKLAVLMLCMFSTITAANPENNPDLNNAITIDIVDWLTNLNFRKRISEKDFIVFEVSVSKS
ncbi:MAG: hypothetical protein KAT04_15145, partial [Methylococcales bacterium]|nr:hypothetical protein [Methylococcales bacterium]